ncbi:MAG: TonB-dependent receptor, partial [Caulobacterales bacterium]|nr:TonB-dependent receptor [Caulobacterales bacterium]
MRGELIERSLQDTQTSVSVVTGEELDESVDKDLFDVIDRLPGVNAEGGGFGFVIRGVAPGGVGGGSGPTVNVQIDGATVPNGQAQRTGSLSTWDLEQVEVLRGPQSTQQGPSALAGAVILRSADPIFEREFKLRGDYGGFNETRVALAANLPLADQLAVRVTFEDYQSDGDIKNIFTGVDNASESLTTYRGKLRFKPNDVFDTVLSYTYTDNRFGNQAIDDDLFPERRVARQFSDTEGTTDTIALRAEYVFSPRWSLSSETAYLKSDYELAIPAQPLDPANTPGGRTVDDASTSQEFKLRYDGDALRGVVGAYYQRLEKDLFFEALIPDASVFGLPPGSAIFGNTLDSENENIALFGELEYDATPKWTFIAGLRADNERQDSVTTQFSQFTPDPFGLSATGEPVALDAEYAAVLPKGSAIYNFTDDVSVSVTAQRAYRAGGAATDFTGNAYEFDPEYSNNYELALRSVLMNDRATFNVNLYYTDYTDMQVSVPGPSGTFVDSVIENAGQATLWGVEVQADLHITDDLEIYANAGYASTEFDEYIGAGADGSPTDLSGNKFPQAPNWTGAIGAAYVFG